MRAFKIALVVVLGMAVFVAAAQTTYDLAKVGGSATTGTGSYVWWTDHTDSIAVETLLSETLTVTEDEYVNIMGDMVTWAVCDSCLESPDSQSVVVQTFTAFNGRGQHIIFTDTFTSISAGDYFEHNFRSDTSLWNQIWFRTILKDSIAMDGDSTADSTQINLLFHVLERPYQDR